MGVGGFNLGLGPPGLAAAQLVQLNGMNPFGANMNMLDMANLSAMGISPEALLEVAWAWRRYEPQHVRWSGWPTRPQAVRRPFAQLEWGRYRW